MASKFSISLVFPVYNDEGTVRKMTEKARKVLSAVANTYQIVIVDDGSPDKSGQLADELAEEFPEVKVLHHEKSKGYGAALRTGMQHSGDFDWICLTDGDDQYDLRELYHIVKLLDRYDMIITFRYCKIYGTWRLFLSAVYNSITRFVFRSQFRDISSGLKLIQSSLLPDLDVRATSPFIGGEMTLQAMLKGYHIGEVGINTYPRQFGSSTSTSWRNIFATILDMARFYRRVFNNVSREELDRKHP